MKRWEWKDDIYGIEIVLIRCRTIDVALRSVVKQENWGTTEAEIVERKNAAACAPYVRDDEKHVGKLFLMFSARVDTKSPFGLSTIGHEACHGAIQVFKDLGIPINIETQEPFAYYQTYLFTETLRRLRDNKR